MYPIQLRPLHQHSMSDEEFYEFCQNNNHLKFERTKDKVIIIMANTGGKSGIRSMALGAKLWLWNEENQYGKVFDSSTAFRLPNGAVRSPDAAWVALVRWDKLTSEEQEKFPPLCPDFVAEIMSPSDLLKDAQEKMSEWMENGCQLAWLFQPSEQHAWIYRAGQPIEVVEGFSITLSGEEVLTGFAFDLSLLG